MRPPWPQRQPQWLHAADVAVVVDGGLLLLPRRPPLQRQPVAPELTRGIQRRVNTGALDAVGPAVVGSLQPPPPRQLKRLGTRDDGVVVVAVDAG